MGVAVRGDGVEEGVLRSLRRISRTDEEVFTPGRDDDAEKNDSENSGIRCASVDDPAYIRKMARETRQRLA